MKRRLFLSSSLLAGLSTLNAQDKAAKPEAKDKKTDKDAKDTKGKDTKTTKPAPAPQKIVKTDEEWKKQLTPEQYDVARKHGTEKPFKNAFNDNKKKGVYSCVCCDQEVYSSEHKFDSGTGWPSFWQPIKDANIGQTEDRKLFYTRMEIHCSRCDAHLGHVFDDATGKGSVPLTPTGKRYCMNSAAMKFTEKK